MKKLLVITEILAIICFSVGEVGAAPDLKGKTTPELFERTALGSAAAKKRSGTLGKTTPALFERTALGSAAAKKRSGTLGKTTSKKRLATGRKRGRKVGKRRGRRRGKASRRLKNRMKGKRRRGPRRKDLR